MDGLKLAGDFYKKCGRESINAMKLGYFAIQVRHYI